MNPGLPEEQIFPIPRGQGPVTIGRTKDNAVFCLHKSLSRKHAQLEIDAGGRVKVTDLQSKNGVFHNGKRVAACHVAEGDTFRCGDITFLVEGSTIRSPAVTKATPISPTMQSSHDDRQVQTLQSPLNMNTAVSPRHFAPSAATKLSRDEEERYKERLFLLIRASELCVSEMSVDRMLDELVTLAVQVLQVDRIALLALDEHTLIMAPRVVKSFGGVGTHYPYSHRVVDWVVDHGSPATFPDVSRDRHLPGDASKDAGIRGAMCVPINPGGGTIGVIYVDSLMKADCFRPDDLALLRAIANMAAVAIEGAALRGGEPKGRSLVPSMPRR
ncbi:MAG: GAF domain-containing protein [Labilithrix sp.]